MNNCTRRGLRPLKVGKKDRLPPARRAHYEEEWVPPKDFSRNLYGSERMVTGQFAREEYDPNAP